MRFLASGDVDRPEETRFRQRVVRLRPCERDLAIEAMQLGEPKPLARSFDKAEGFLQLRFCAGRVSRQQQNLNHHGRMKRVRSIPARTMHSLNRGAKGRDVFFGRFLHRSRDRMVDSAEQAKLLHFFFGAVRDEFGAVPLARFKIGGPELGKNHGEKQALCDGV